DPPGRGRAERQRAGGRPPRPPRPRLHADVLAGDDERGGEAHAGVHVSPGSDEKGRKGEREKGRRATRAARLTRRILPSPPLPRSPSPPFSTRGPGARRAGG